MTDTPFAVVTGASRGIGLELAKQFAEHGFDLLINAEDDAIHDAAAQLRGSGAQVQACHADLARYEGVERLYGDILATGRPVDAAALNAGSLLITSSIASTMPGSFQAVYNASKSFVQSFAEALHNELKDTGVTITSLMPGPTDTSFFERADMLDTNVGQGPKDDPSDVARQGFEALMAGEVKVVAASLRTTTQGLVNKVLPDTVKAAAHRVMAEPKSEE